MNSLLEHLLPRVVARFKGMRRQNGQPYITHPLEVMCALSSPLEKILGLLHDYAEIADLNELGDLGIPEDLLAKARLLAKPFEGDLPVHDPLRQAYILTLACDPLCSKVKYHDLATNQWQEESPRPHDAPFSENHLRCNALLKDAAEGKVYFCSRSYAVNIFSNFYPVELTIDGVCWKSAEHFYQAAKFSPLYSPEPKEDIYQAIAQADVAGMTKSLADKHFSPEARQRWDLSRKKFEVTAAMLNTKFAQGSVLRQVLQQTSHLELIHESKDDRLWGADRRGRGRNLLGKVLMLMRERNGDCCADDMLP